MINPIKKVIVDTDPGIDDAMAIMLALSAHRKQTAEAVAITLVCLLYTSDAADE